ncbi:MAG TPA: L-lactate permease [Anaerolineales bacterium]|nr:L-lactate permease [Anaerolineales bacterium]
MNFTLALTPIVLILILMVGFRWGAAKAGAAGYLTALVVAILFFGAGRDLLAYAHVKALLLALDVLLVIWAAFLLYRVADEAGAIRTIGEALPHLTSDLGMQALIIGWVFASFLQGVGGFGVPVAVIAPILIGLGFEPLAAVILPSIGHGWAVTFGSLGSSFQALMASTGLPGTQLAPAAAIFLGLSALPVGWMVAHSAAGWAAVRRLFLPVLILGLAMGAVQFLVAIAGLWNIAAFAGSLVGLLIGFPLARRIRGEQQNNGVLNVRAVLVALTGYAFLVLIILGVQLTPPLKEFLGQIVIQLDFPQIETSLGFITPAGAGRNIPVFRHTGMLLVYVSLLAYLVYRRAGLYAPGSVKRILDGTLRRVLSSSVSILSMVTMAVIMEHAGMTNTLASGLAGGMGSMFPFVAPWIGGLGAFMTGSNTNSNVVFGALQLRTAEMLGFSAAIILAGQTAGAALASVLAPTKIVVGASTAGMAGREGEIMRKLLVYTGLLVLLVSLMTSVAVWLLL